MIGPSFARPFFACALSSVAGSASRDSRGQGARPGNRYRALGAHVGPTDEVKSNGKRRGTRAHGSSATQASHSLSKAVFLRARVEAGISTSTADNQGQDSTLMRIWQQCDYAIYIRMPDIG